MINSPCKGCERREVGCRSGCEDWKDYEARKAEDKKLRREATAPQRQADAYVRERVKRAGPWFPARQLRRRGQNKPGLKWDKP